ncbi:MAG: hypothetical protein HFK10_03990 [Clostridia bacterium]|nr:hypothetical protein [Clostridia bacterium]
MKKNEKYYSRFFATQKVDFLLQKRVKRNTGLLLSKGNGYLLAKGLQIILTLFAAKKRGKNRTRGDTLQTVFPLL